MKLIDSIHEASQYPHKAEEIASKSSIALVVDAVILAALVFGALWLLKEPEKSSDVVIVYIALCKLQAIDDNQSAFRRAYPVGNCPIEKSEFAKLKKEISKSINRKMEYRDSKT